LVSQSTQEDYQKSSYDRQNRGELCGCRKRSYTFRSIPTLPIPITTDSPTGTTAAAVTNVAAMINNNNNNNINNNLSTSTIGTTDDSRDENTRNEITIAAAATDAATDADVTAINETASPKRKKKTKTKKKKQDLEEGCTSPPSLSTPTPSSSRFITSRSSRTKLISPISLPTPLSLNNDNAIDGIDDDDNEKTTKEEQNPATTTNDNNNNNNTTTTTTKYWTDTDVLPNGLETNQIPGYMRALS